MCPTRGRGHRLLRQGPDGFLRAYGEVVIERAEQSVGVQADRSCRSDVGMKARYQWRKAPERSEPLERESLSAGCLAHHLGFLDTPPSWFSWIQGAPKP